MTPALFLNITMKVAAAFNAKAPIEKYGRAGCVYVPDFPYEKFPKMDASVADGFQIKEIPHDRNTDAQLVEMAFLHIIFGCSDVLYTEWEKCAKQNLALTGIKDGGIRDEVIINSWHPMHVYMKACQEKIYDFIRLTYGESSLTQYLALPDNRSEEHGWRTAGDHYASLIHLLFGRIPSSKVPQFISSQQINCANRVRNGVFSKYNLL